MKTINGNNKLERQINKALKYNELVLVEASNKYLRIKEWNDAHTFFVAKSFVKFGVSQYGEYAMIVADNLAKPIFIKPWNVIAANHGDGTQAGYYVFVKKIEDANKLNALVAGDDGVLKLNADLCYSKQIRKN